PALDRDSPSQAERLAKRAAPLARTVLDPALGGFEAQLAAFERRVRFDPQALRQVARQQFSIGRVQPQQPLVDASAEQGGSLGYPRGERYGIDRQRLKGRPAQG